MKTDSKYICFNEDLATAVVETNKTNVKNYDYYIEILLPKKDTQNGNQLGTFSITKSF
jgi:hypothetical protein